jgi:dihydropyrimidine dehydrogenase (NAD+) subunit PreA
MDINLSINFCGVKFPNPFVVSQVPPVGDIEVVAGQLQAGWGGVILRKTSLTAVDEKPTLSTLRRRAPIYRGVDSEEKHLVDLGWFEPSNFASLESTERAIATLKGRFPNNVIIASMVGANREEWLKVSRRLNQAGADLIECDFSCRTREFPSIVQDVKLLEKAARYVREGARNTPVIVKIPGHLQNPDEVAATLKDAAMDGLCVFYEPKGIPGINLNNFVPFPNVGNRSTLSTMGGVAVKPYTLAMLAEWGRRQTGLPLAVLGGAYDWRDAIEFILMGASIIEFHGAVLQLGMGLVEHIRSGISDYLEEKMISSVDKLLGKSLQFVGEPEEVDRNIPVVAAVDDKLCTRCGACYRVCEGLGYRAIGFTSQRKPAVDKKKCVGDGLCVAVCPVVHCMSLKRLAR